MPLTNSHEMPVPSSRFPVRCDGPSSIENPHPREGAVTGGMSMRDLYEHVGVFYGHLLQASRGRRTMGAKVRARVESALQAPAEVAPERTAAVDRHAVFARLSAHEISQNETARRAGITSSHLSQIVNGLRNPSPVMLKRLHGVLFRRARSEAPVEPTQVKVLGWRKGERRGIVVHDAGGHGSESITAGPGPLGSAGRDAKRVRCPIAPPMYRVFRLFRQDTSCVNA